MAAHQEHFAPLHRHEVTECMDDPRLTLGVGLPMRERKIKVPPRLLHELEPVRKRASRQLPFTLSLHTLNPESGTLRKGRDRVHCSGVGARINHVNTEGS